MKPSPTIQLKKPRKPQVFFTAALIASATGAIKKTVHRTAVREQWPMRKRANFYEYAVPLTLRAQCNSYLLKNQRSGLATFTIGTDRRAEIGRAQHRFAALCALEVELMSGPHEVALIRVAKTFHANSVSLRQWAANYSTRGFAGLLESKRGNSGRQPKRGKASR